MAEGRLYEVDLRLRPSGQSGPVATSLPAFESYQKTEAWVWEHLALTRARAVSGRADLRAAVEEVRCDVLTSGYASDKIKTETHDMRTRLAESARSTGIWDVKSGAGGLQDIELCGQAVGLMSRSVVRSFADQIAAGRAAGLVSDEQAATLMRAYTLFSGMQLAVRLLTTKPLDPDNVGEGGIRLLLRDCGCDSLNGLENNLQDCRKSAALVVDALLS